MKFVQVCKDPILYTEGSKADHGVAAVLVVFLENGEIRNFRKKLSYKNTIYQAEILEILETIHW